MKKCRLKIYKSESQTFKEVYVKYSKEWRSKIHRNEGQRFMANLCIGQRFTAMKVKDSQ